ncbi:DUF1365 domain-containing protein [Bremerella cremea]|uniref:DUF1365 domain-containing protein n=1 Tax=Bremerella cremea TaxID=1031537 RepID=UPI0031EC7E96
MRSCLYEGLVTHSRHTPVPHHFRYRITMACFDLAELDQIVGPNRLLSDHRWAGVSFPRDVHLRHLSGSLDARVRQFVEQQSGKRPEGSIRLVTQLRHFGYYFSPLNLFLIEGKTPTAAPSQIIAEVNNIPWGEQHAYLLEPSWNDEKKAWTCEHPKQMHVSPFMPMDQRYRWTFRSFGERLSVGLENIDAGRPIFGAGMDLEKKLLAPRGTRRFLPSVPAMSLKVVAAIYLEAWKLWWKRCPIYPHPRKQSGSEMAAPATKPL